MRGVMLQSTYGLAKLSWLAPYMGTPTLLPFSHRLDGQDMFKIREWERFKFHIDYELSQVSTAICLALFQTVDGCLPELMLNLMD
jgi:hypothetical protein